jgi:uroporphyrinogen-III synthase
MRLLVTRPEPDSERTAMELRARGHELTLAPLLRVEPAANAELGPGPWTAILLTSANAARAIAAHPRRGELVPLPVLTVGQSSAAAARGAGFLDVTPADGDGGDLARLAAGRFSGAGKPLLYLAGEERARDLGGELAASGLRIETVIVYRTVKVAAFPPNVRAALEAGAIDGVLHFSRRSAEAYLECARAVFGPALAPVHYCVSARAAEPLQAAGAAQIHIAARPDEAGMLALVTSRP